MRHWLRRGCRSRSRVSGEHSALPSAVQLERTSTERSLSIAMATHPEKSQPEFSADDRLDKLPPLTEQYAIDDLLTEHFGFAPKVFTGHIFNIINEAIYDTVASVEDAVIASYFPESENPPGKEPALTSNDSSYPTKEDIAKSLNQLETLLCSSIDNQFDLLEIWLHRNVFNFPNMREDVLKHLRFNHMSLWEQFYLPNSDQPVLADSPDWEKMKAEEEELWSQLDKLKSACTQAKDDYLSLLAVSKALDRKLTELKAVSNQLNQIQCEAAIIYDPESHKPLDLSTQSSILLGHFKNLLTLERTQEELLLAVNFKPPSNSNRLTVDEELVEDEDLKQPVPYMAKYQHAINQLVKAKMNDFFAELTEKGSIETENDEGLLEVLNHVAGKGKATVPNTPLHHERL
ncbi:hypothetical protein O181_064023 [Austropuccinia psidii MF-1]|uniref:Uncharacterized protein n=1 Tax=Austropuccinia psidii MF-1 TaxID=1389203 RepID=A0A9Q3ESQ9_9BASI|nr:hypothetical protein [Austropuccinia psidii MF-1]